MPRHARSTSSPWIESLVLGYGGEEGTSSTRQLRAHVIGTGQMSQSQARASDCITGLLFLSDGVLQIPAILTASAWEHLQAQEDRESATSLLNSTVCIQDYTLQFHMASEQTKCRFFLTVGDLVTTAAGPLKQSPSCCTTRPSIRQKICQTWRALLGQEEQLSQMSQCGFDLSELLGEWQHDCMQAILEDVRERRMMASSLPASPHPSTSACTSLLTRRDTCAATSWDVDRASDKGGKCFSVPINFLLIPDEDAQQLQTAPNAGSGTPSQISAACEDRKTDLAHVCTSSEAGQPSLRDAESHTVGPGVVQIDCDSNANTPLAEDDMSYEEMITGLIDSNITPLSNPWDIFPPPCDTSSSDVSSEATPPQSLQNPTGLDSEPDHTGIRTSMQPPAHHSKEICRGSEQSYLPPYQSYLPPYQNPQLPSDLLTAAGSSAPASGSPPEPFPRLSVSDDLCTNAAQRNPQTLERDGKILGKGKKETAESQAGESKKKRSEVTPETVLNAVDEEEGEAETSGSPPSWLFETQSGTRATEDRGHIAGTALRETPTVHSDGRPFSYSYQASGQNLQDFSRFRVWDSWLQWAVKYLVAPMRTDHPHNASVASSQTASDRTDATSL